MRYILFLSLILVMSTVDAQKTLHEFSIQKLNSEETLDFATYKGKKILLVNVASKCGYTKQYSDLQALYEKYKDKLVIVGFPCNQFGGQEPGTEAEIVQFCSANYGVSFPMTEKIKVKGKEQHPIYQFLTQKEQNGLDDFNVNWNFNKFLVDENGKLIKHYKSGVKPMDEEIVNIL
ncbi:MAG: glutathione peroxidase [Flavobacteriales bacterium]|nr:glutathione peroxidase [Flavobacteriales bacterium]